MGVVRTTVVHNHYCQGRDALLTKNDLRGRGRCCCQHRGWRNNLKQSIKSNASQQPRRFGAERGFSPSGAHRPRSPQPQLGRSDFDVFRGLR